MDAVDDREPVSIVFDAPYMSNPIVTGLLSLAVLLPVTADGQSSDPPSTGPPERQLRPGDVIRLDIWREPDLSGEFLVDEAGVVVFPRLGEKRVMVETPESLEATLLAEYRRYLVNPSIDITILRRVNVLGAVADPGLYTVDPTISVADVLATAGGITPIGNVGKIQVIRAGVVVTSSLDPGSLIISSPIQSGDQVFVPERSWISRNARVVTAIVVGAASISIALFRK